MDVNKSSGIEKETHLRLMLDPNMHLKEFQCPVCAKYFSRKFSLDAHMLIHKGEKPYSCQFCGKCFRQKGTLMRHKALHSSKNLFHCSLCNHGFRQKNVFIFHLRHRHNVSTETLDRRKYRTEPKDYQSIMDTLPPFVQADSVAIASSEKHFDAILSESIQKPVTNAETLQYNHKGEHSLQAVYSNNDTFHMESVSQDNASAAFNDHDNLNLTNFDSSDYRGANEETSVDIKPFFSCNFSEDHTTEFPSKNSSINPNDTENRLFSHLSAVNSSDDVNSETITCIPCKLDFNSEIEFKDHMKTHMQSVLLMDVNTDTTPNCDATSSVQSKNSELSDSLSVSALFSQEKSVCSSNITSAGLSKNKSRGDQQKLKCPICNVCFYTEAAFKNHSKMHDSYSLLKFICASFENKNNSSSFQKHFSLVSNESSNIEASGQFIDNGKFCKKIDRFRKSSVQTKNVFKRGKSKFKIFICMQCGKKLPNKLLLEYHRQLHLSTKGFFCRYCRKNFSSKKLLLSHTRLYHMRTFTCSKCSKNFTYRRLFDCHQKQCVRSILTRTLNGSSVNFPVVDIESILNSDSNGIVGIIPVYAGSGESSRIKSGIPVISVSQIKALYTS